MKNKTLQLLHLKKRIIRITSGFCILCAVLFSGILFSAAWSAYSEIRAQEISNSETGMENSRLIFQNELDEICRMDWYLVEQYENGVMAPEEFGTYLENFDLPYCGVLEGDETKIKAYYPWNISYYSFQRTMDTFFANHEISEEIHFFAHNFSNSRNGVVMVHFVNVENIQMIFVYLLESEFYWSDYVDNSLRNGFFVYDSALKEVAPSKTSFVNLNEVLEELETGNAQGSVVFADGGNSRLVSYIQCPGTGIYLFNSIPLTSFSHFLQQQVLRLLPWCIAVGIGVVGVIYLYYRRIFRPVILIGEALNKEMLNEGTDDGRSFPESGFSPIMELVSALKNKILEVKESEYKERLLKEQAELINLQSQINPHFMYNTLESIRDMSILEGGKDAPKMVKALADFFRYTISKKETIVSIRDELKNVEDYLKIQNYRFQNKFIYQRQFDENADYMDYKVIKMMLQPIVENAIFHGLEPVIGQGTITIQIYTTTKQLRISIKDDGVGIDPETLHSLNERILADDHVDSVAENKHGIALKNVSQRIHLYFGREYGLTIYSKEKVGTEVLISIPIMTDLSDFSAISLLK